MGEGENLRRKPGRPPKGEDTRRHVLSVRLKDKTKNRLAKAAVEQERALADEMEQRLAASFDRDDRVGGEHIRSIGDAVMAMLLVCQAKAGRPWTSDDGAALYAFDRVTMMLANIMGVVRPETLAEGPEKTLLEAYKIIADLDEQAYAAKAGGLIGPTYRSYRHDPLLDRMMSHRLETAPIPEQVSARLPSVDAQEPVKRAKPGEKSLSKAEKDVAARALSQKLGDKPPKTTAKGDEAA